MTPASGTPKRGRRKGSHTALRRDRLLFKRIIAETLSFSFGLTKSGAAKMSVAWCDDNLVLTTAGKTLKIAAPIREIQGSSDTITRSVAGPAGTITRTWGKIRRTASAEDIEWFSRQIGGFYSWLHCCLLGDTSCADSSRLELEKLNPTWPSFLDGLMATLDRLCVEELQPHERKCLAKGAISLLLRLVRERGKVGDEINRAPSVPPKSRTKRS